MEFCPSFVPVAQKECSARPRLTPSWIIGCRLRIKNLPTDYRHTNTYRNSGEQPRFPPRFSNRGSEFVAGTDENDLEPSVVLQAGNCSAALGAISDVQALA